VEGVVILAIMAFERCVTAAACRAIAGAREAPDVRKWVALGAVLGLLGMMLCWYLASGPAGPSGRQQMRQWRESGGQQAP
jgi:drug/metabolite transporter (DMT)-like permease